MYILLKISGRSLQVVVAGPNWVPLTWPGWLRRGRRWLSPPGICQGCSSLVHFDQSSYMWWMQLICMASSMWHWMILHWCHGNPRLLSHWFPVGSSRASISSFTSGRDIDPLGSQWDDGIPHWTEKSTCSKKHQPEIVWSSIHLQFLAEQNSVIMHNSILLRRVAILGHHYCFVGFHFFWWTPVGFLSHRAPKSSRISMINQPIQRAWIHHVGENRGVRDLNHPPGVALLQLSIYPPVI